MILLAHSQADRTTDVVQARNWIDLAGATLSGMSRPHPVLESWRLQALARVESKEGRPEQALATFKRARGLMEKVEGPEHPDIAIVENNIGLILQEMNRLDEALVHMKRASDLAAKVLGPDHPRVSMSLCNAGEVLNALKRYDEARAAIERALQIWKRAGSSPFYVAWALTNLGEADLGLGRTKEARSHLEEAIQLYPAEETSLRRRAELDLANTQAPQR